MHKYLSLKFSVGSRKPSGRLSMRWWWNRNVFSMKLLILNKKNRLFSYSALLQRGTKFFLWNILKVHSIYFKSAYWYCKLQRWAIPTVLKISVVYKTFCKSYTSEILTCTLRAWVSEILLSSSYNVNFWWIAISPEYKNVQCK